MRNSLLTGLFFSLLVLQLQAQEFSCTVTVNADKIPGANRQVYVTREKALEEFVNQQAWTNLDYRPEERISAGLTLTLLERTGDRYTGNIQVQSSRPVYRASYLTPILNIKDTDFSFTYTEFEPLTFSENVADSNLVSVVAYYVYLMLGMDADTFVLDGGTSYYLQAQNIVLQAQQTGYKGWNQDDGFNTRFALIDQLLSPAYGAYRKALYQYHLTGLDRLEGDKKKAKVAISASIIGLKEIYEIRPNAFILRVFMDAKAAEIVAVFTGGPSYKGQRRLSEVLQQISPVNTPSWKALR
ncbi:MAG: DUF4835 family protein [Lutibacter sp.]|nr:DUF4835 family protein [Lutibacter sp.]